MSEPQLPTTILREIPLPMTISEFCQIAEDLAQKHGAGMVHVKQHGRFIRFVLGYRREPEEWETYLRNYRKKNFEVKVRQGDPVAPYPEIILEVTQNGINWFSMGFHPEEIPAVIEALKPYASPEIP